MRPKHVPIRTCIVCRRQRPKREMIRVVRSPEGRVHPDTTGKARGRGAYLCPERGCWERAVQAARGPLDHALKGPVSPEELAELRMFAQTLPAVAPPASQPDTNR